MTEKNKKVTLSDNELMRYARQILLPEWGIEAQLNLANSKVAVVGVGGLGCPTAMLLARAGVGSLVLIDDDIIEASNLQRQTLFNQQDLKKYKAVCASQQLTVENEFIKSVAITERLTANNIEAILADSDLIIDCTDNFESRDLINKYCVKHASAFISSAAIAQSGQLAFYNLSRRNENRINQPCYTCVFGEEVEVVQNCSDIGVLTPTTHVIASQASHIALHYLGLNSNILENKLLVWEGANLMQKSYQIKRHKHCMVCRVDHTLLDLA